MEKEQFQLYLQNTATLNTESLEEVKKLTSDFPWFTTGWLLYLKNLKNLEHPDYDAVLKKVAVMVPDRKVLFKYLNNELPVNVPVSVRDDRSTLYNLEGDVELKSEKSLIDKFLSTDGSRLRSGKVNLGVNGNNGDKVNVEQSVKEDEDLVTETLASIYYQQKNYDKALDAYQKLSLKYPEKSVYFAGRIKEIELLKTNN
ncbi:tetratricopeptide repeat protein [Draconibacterium sp. IB214405]|uniref:tetratricopeptide repeat protein n=1 Tax=Draconibacterium sp. IB214405 TaxID=3097352 RepID=UPI002A138C82|nr:tetratricopeptide repeat protein [Draconibacterium sp. IB214405]MDX8338533.1 tetratricopeptide repeat protein [Draconibacterium sp. IB214405]